MKLNCQLKGTFQDIRALRKLRGISVREFAEQMGRKEAYVYDLENGKINLTLADYHWYLELLGFKASFQTSISTEEILMSVQTKGKMYMKQSRRELAKQVLIHHMELRQEEWCAEGLAVCKLLLEYLDQKEVRVQIVNPDYAIYDGTDGGNYDRIGDVFTLDLDGFAEDLILNPELILDERWTIQTIEGPCLDFYHLLTIEEARGDE